jgi:hypothetical protein
VRCYPDELSLVAQQACEQVVKTLMSGLALHSLMESTVDHTDTLSCQTAMFSPPVHKLVEPPVIARLDSNAPIVVPSVDHFPSSTFKRPDNHISSRRSHRRCSPRLGFPALEERMLTA